jgi:hypothetical protein
MEEDDGDGRTRPADPICVLDNNQLSQVPILCPVLLLPPKSEVFLIWNV